MPDTRVRVKVGLPRVFDPHPTCPAGAPIGETLAGSGVRCRVTHDSIVSTRDPSSLVSYCCSRYRECPTWIAEKEHIAANRRGDLVRV